MNTEDVRIRNLEGPFSRHLYIGFVSANKDIVLGLRVMLEKQGVICYLRDENVNIKESIREGVGTSQKCLLFLSSDYVKDKSYQMETSAVLEKSERFSRDVVIILKGDDLEVMPDKLREFKTQLFKPEMLSDEIFLGTLADVITRVPNVQLAVLSKQNIGYGSACGYYYGFLHLVLPDFKNRLIEETLKNDQDLVPKTVQRMLIIMPESCFCATKLNLPDKIEFTEKYVVRVVHRAGNQKRDYKSSLYKLIDKEKRQEYYFVGELATPLLTMYETYAYGLCGMKKDELYIERDAFYCTLRAILSHPYNAECYDQFKLLYWSDPATEKPNQLNLYDFLLPVLRDEISLQQEKESIPSKIEAISNVNLSSKNPPSKIPPTFEHVPVDGSNPARIYEISQYPMDHRPRGLCLIVNIANFDKGHTHLQPRRGAAKDAELLKKLFEDLHFEVQVHNDLGEQTLGSLFVTMNNTNHTNYDAFVCCIMSHGKLGVIYTSDGKEVEILELVDYFTDRKCPSLKGKPKMFFIQACQTGGPEPEHGTAGNSHPHDGSTGDQLTLPSSLITATDIETDARSDPTDDTLLTTRKHKAVLVPGSPDFLMSYSTLPWSSSYRDTELGSFYTRELDVCLRKGMEIDIALKMVSAGVKEELRKQGERDGVEERFQLPFHLTSGMDRLIFL